MLLCLFGISAHAWTVQFTNPDNWTTVNAYCFGGTGGEVFDGWPGEAMKTINTAQGTIYTISYEGAEPANNIFNGSGGQTRDLKFYADKLYNTSGVIGGLLAELEPEPEPAPD